jgi:hypothetical protein
MRIQRSMEKAISAAVAVCCLSASACSAPAPEAQVAESTETRTPQSTETATPTRVPTDAPRPTDTPAPTATPSPTPDHTRESRARFEQGLALYVDGDLDGAIAEFDQAVTLDPQYALPTTTVGTLTSYRGILVGRSVTMARLSP